MSDPERGGGDAEPDAPDPGDGEGGEAPGAMSLLDLMLAEQAAEVEPALPSFIDGIVVGRIEAIDAGAPRVTFRGAPREGVPARTMTALRDDDAGRDVALMFEAGDPRRPVVMGRMASLFPASVGYSDGRRLEVAAGEELVLRCGEASITLTRAGQVVIEGAYVITRSSGVNRIQGGAVEIN